MRPFVYSQSDNTLAATQLAMANPAAKYLAGGTNLVDLMKEDVERPTQLIDITRLPLTQVSELTTGPNQGGVSIGGLGFNADTANHPLIRQRYPLLTQAILAGASAQIRNMATNGGNLNQRTRCPYFYELATPCNKRVPGSGCSALAGINRLHALFGWSEQCVAVYPSDMAIALAALDATVTVQTPTGSTRAIPFADYHRLPGDTPHIDNNLAPGELVTAIELPASPFADKFCYIKVRDRSSYAFALVSVAAALDMRADGTTIRQVRLAMGGVAHKPWRAREAERFLVGKPANDATFAQAAEAEMSGARPLAHNQYKVELGRRVIVRALSQALTGV